MKSLVDFLIDGLDVVHSDSEFISCLFEVQELIFIGFYKGFQSSDFVFLLFYFGTVVLVKVIVRELYHVCTRTEISMSIHQVLQFFLESIICF